MSADPLDPGNFEARISSLENDVANLGNVIAQMREQLATMSTALDNVERQANRADNTASDALASVEAMK